MRLFAPMAILFGLMVAGASTGPQSEAKADILIGVGDTFLGPAGWGFSTRRSVDLALLERNEAGGVLGEKIRMVDVDDGCDADQAVAAARKLVEAGVELVIGHACSHAAIAASAVYEGAGVIYIASSASNPKLTAGGGPNVFRLRGHDAQVVALVTDYLIAHWLEANIALLHDGRVYGRYLADGIRQRLNDHGVEEAVYAQIEPGQLDFTGLIDELEAADVDVVFFGGYPNEAGLFIRQARDSGAEFLLMGSDSIPDEEFVLIAGDAAEGTLAIDPPYPSDEARVAGTLALYHEHFPVEAGTASLDINFNAYTAVHVWADAVERAGSLAPDAVIRELRNGEFDTVYGTIGFDDKGDVTGFNPWSWWVFENGAWTEKENRGVGPSSVMR